jgi:hypothetical protein
VSRPGRVCRSCAAGVVTPCIRPKFFRNSASARNARQPCWTSHPCLEFRSVFQAGNVGSEIGYADAPLGEIQCGFFLDITGPISGQGLLSRFNGVGDGTLGASPKLGYNVKSELS